MKNEKLTMKNGGSIIENEKWRMEDGGRRKESELGKVKRDECGLSRHFSLFIFHFPLVHPDPQAI